MRALPWILGGAAAAAYWWWRRQADQFPEKVVPPTPDVLPGTWVWPVPRYQGRPPVISDGFDSPRKGLKRHGGVDIMYARQPRDSFPPGSVNGSAGHVMPDNTFALAASDGVIWSAGSSPYGFEVVIDHGPTLKMATYYTHLEKLLVAERQPGRGGPRVRAGQPIGIIGFSPLDPGKLKHLHFALWNGGPEDAIDPAPLIRSWKVLTDERDTLVARNARRFRPRNGLIYRPVGASGEAYPEWVRALKGKAGVYLIRELGELVYVGSSAGRLYDTLTRHFQMWRRFKGFWKGQYGEGHDPGLTYDRASCEVAVRVTSPSEAFGEEMRLIQLLQPRDNLIGQLAADDF